MRTAESIEKEIGSLGYEVTFMTRKEIKELPSILKKDETIQGLVQGMYSANTWLIVCTNTRMLFLDKGMFFGLKQLEFSLEKISSVSFKTGLLTGSVMVGVSSGNMSVDNIVKGDVKRFADAVNKAIEENKTQTRSVKVESNFSVVDQLEKLAELKIKGILSEEEFVAQKKKILAA